MKSPMKTFALALMFSTQLVAGSAFAQTGSKPEPLVIQDQGSFAVGGSVATTPAGILKPEAVPVADFKKLTRMPIVIYYGDNFPVEPTKERGQDNWRVRSRWRSSGSLQSTSTAAMPAWCISRRSASRATPIF
jgi:hypothetical protein